MSSPSPQSSASPPPCGSKPTNNSLASDANIRNFAPVARIMKMALPENAKIAKEAKECMQECVSEFISFITSEGKLSSFPGWQSRIGPDVLTYHSVREVSSRKEENREWRGYPLCHDITWV